MPDDLDEYEPSEPGQHEALEEGTLLDVEPAEAEGGGEAEKAPVSPSMGFTVQPFCSDEEGEEEAVEEDVVLDVQDGQAGS